MWRYAVVYAQGGVYADVDTDCVKPISSWLRPECDILIGLENDVHFCQWTFAAIPRSPYLKSVLQLIVERLDFQKGLNITDGDFVHHYTGPGVFTNGIGRALAERLKLPSHSVTWSPRQWMEYLRRIGGAKSHGICLEDQDFFGGNNVQNIYASQQSFPGWKSWTVAASELRVKAHESLPGP